MTRRLENPCATSSIGYLFAVVALLGASAPLAAGSRDEPTDAPPRPPFVEVATNLGLDFVHHNGSSGAFYMAEINGAGCAVFDIDDDGDLDVYFVDGGPLPRSEPADLPRDRVFRNQLVEDGRLRFVDITEASGVRATGYGFGVATGDFDNDGRTDLYLTNFGANELWRNAGDGRFEEATARAGVADDRWSVGATFFDYDRDGWLDLYVGNYVAFDLEGNKVCRSATGARDYCGPNAYAGVTDRLFRNRGDGTFEDVSRASEIDRRPGRSLGVVAADFDLDGWLDLYVTNDGEANFLWRNQGDGTFVEEALLAGAAVNRDGQPEASMGVDAADVDGDGDEDLFMTHLITESNTFYRNDGAGLFADATTSVGLSIPSLRRTSWGSRFFDYDNDGRLDLFVANGAVRTVESLATEGDSRPFHEPNQLFRGVPAGWVEVSAEAGPALELSEVSRGVAFGDLDNDGDTDLLVANNDGAARFLRNEVGNRAHWIGVDVRDRGRPALGAQVELAGAGMRAWRRLRVDGSFASSSDPRILVGLGSASSRLTAKVTFVDGTTEEWRGLQADRYHRLVRGTAAPR